MTKEYYIAPSQDTFNNIKLCCLVVWAKYNHKREYMIPKMKLVLEMENISDNYMSMIALFDIGNQYEFFQLINTSTVEVIEKALASVGSTTTLAILANARAGNPQYL